MNVKAAVLFVVFASCFLFMLYKLMSSWFIDVLVVLFCIGGIEVLTSNKSVKNLYFCIGVRKKKICAGKRRAAHNVFDIAQMHVIKTLCCHYQIKTVFTFIGMLFSTKSSVTMCFLVSVCRACKLAWLLFCPGVVYYL